MYCVLRVHVQCTFETYTVTFESRIYQSYLRFQLFCILKYIIFYIYKVLADIALYHYLSKCCQILNPFYVTEFHINRKGRNTNRFNKPNVAVRWQVPIHRSPLVSMPLNILSPPQLVQHFRAF